MQIAIVGLAGSGKTTVFNTLTRGHAQTGGYGGMELHVGTVKVPDERLDRLAEIFKPKKIVHADVTYFDLPAPPAFDRGPGRNRRAAGRSAGPPARGRRPPACRSGVRRPGRAAPRGFGRPWRDLERLDLEFTLADLSVMEKRLERLRASGHHGTPAEREANDRELALLERLHEPLAAGRPLRGEGLTPDEEKSIRGFRFLTQKPVLVLLNVGEADLPREAEIVAGIAGRYGHAGALVDALSAKIEMELGELEPEEAAVFMDELGLKESSLDRVIRLSYRLLGLISFLTAGPDEVRAWPIPDGSNAVDAAGAIHTDLAHGFIRAEVVPYEDLLALKTMAEARKHGKLRSEGKTYLVHDGDVVEILFSK